MAFLHPLPLRRTTATTLPHWTSPLRPTRLRLRASSTPPMPPLKPPPTPPLTPAEASQGFYPPPGWGWQKQPPKTSLPPDKARTVKPWILNLIQLIHWLPFVTLIAFSHLLLRRLPVLTALLGGSTARVLALLVSPVTQVFGGTTAVLMHEYEGWQVAQFAQPLDARVIIPAYNNEWLREVAYKFLFTFQGTGLMAFNLAVLGFSGWMVGLVAVSLVAMAVGPSGYKATFKGFGGQPVFPLPWTIAVPFIVNAVVNLFAFFKLFGWVGLVAPVVLLVGGLFEGIVAESTFNQWHHFIAFVGVNAGLLIEMLLFRRLLL